MSAPNNMSAPSNVSAPKKKKVSAPNKKRSASKPRRRMFQGDVDVIELRRRLSSAANVIPEPPLPEQQQSTLRSPSFAKFALSVGVLSLLFWGVLEGMRSDGAYPIYPSPSNVIASPTTPNNAIPSTTALVTTGNGARPMTPVLLGVQDRRALVNEPLALGAVLLGAGEEALHIGGLIEGSRLSAGEKLGATGWRVPARDVAGVVVVPPVSFVGFMNAIIQVLSVGNVPVDTQYARLEWVATTAHQGAPAKAQPEWQDSPLSSPAGKLDPQRVAWLLRRGAELMQLGDFSAARLLLRPAAEAGDAQAALMLGATFDPAIIADLGVRGLAPDAGAARVWYQRAMASGSTEASHRIERLARMSQ